MSDKEFSIPCRDGDRIFVDAYDDGVWLSMSVRGGSAYTVMSREQAQEVLKALKSVLASETA